MTSMMEGRWTPSADTRRWAARRVIAQHVDEMPEGAAGGCSRCGEGDPCPGLVAAISTLRRLAGVTR
ncbi:hypothetical protein [Micromonospora aurantiaca (nom. illeg.)]|uniref:hypothetical protein n=1 Tax=Micromonospora aurantiaca (nom. illeg.) TaxID=47850 RepID=UPI003F4A0F58